MKNLILTLAALVSLLSACQEKDPDEPIYHNEYFPNTVGIVWNYERYDSLQNKLDTVIVAITGDTILSGNTCKMWEYIYSDATDTAYVRQNFDSVIFFDPAAEMIAQIYYIPFQLGKGWFNPDDVNDTSYVADILDIVIDNVAYHDVSLIDREISGPNYYVREKIWFKPHLGVVQLERDVFNTMLAKDEIWKMKNEK